MDKNMTWIKLYRSLLTNDLYLIKPFDRVHAWIDLLLLAENKTHKKLWRGKLTEFKRGDVNLSIERLAERWGWSRGKVERFLSNLNDMEMISLNVHRNRTVITIEKWEFFQGQQTSKRTSECASNKQSERAKNEQSNDEYLKNNNKNNKESKKEVAPLPSPEIDDEEEDDGEWVDAGEWLERNGKK